MKKGFFIVALLVSSCAIFSGGIKTSPEVTTINPSMSATIGNYTFIAATTVPSTLNPQLTYGNDSSITLVITGRTSDPVNPDDKIVLTVTRYKGIDSTYSIVKGQASAVYVHGSVTSPADGGIVAITKVTSTSIIGYFSFTNVADSINVTNGAFNVGKP